MSSSKIKFTRVWMKNFRSISNSGMEVILDESDTTLICSTDNGAGKTTTTLYALAFGLFDSIYGKDTKKPSLVYSRSNKDCVVEIDFETKGSQWKVRRGIKPNLFDIYKDGVRVEDEAATKDYQAYLESILGFNEKVFYYGVALGPDRFVPFAKMSASDRRNYVEPIFDIAVFTPMNNIAKEKTKALKREIENIEYQIDMAESKMSGMQRTLQILTDQQEKRLASGNEELASLITERDSVLTKIEAGKAKMVGMTELLQEMTLKNEKIKNIGSMVLKFQEKKRDANHTVDRIASLDCCPTCQQSVTDGHKHAIKTMMLNDVPKWEHAIAELQDQLRLNTEELKEMADRFDVMSKIKEAVRSFETRVEILNAQIEKMKRDIDKSDEAELIETEKKMILEVYDSLLKMKEQYTLVKENEKDHLTTLEILKDDALKAKIIRDYLPFLNGKVNEYLDAMNMYVNITITEDFKLEMFSPSRKNQTLESLSTGQLRRVDLAVLLAFRDIATEKASVSTNILIFDEILENLSEQGVADFMEMWGNKFADKNINLFVITQRGNEFDQYFDRSIKYALRDDFTVVI